MKARVKATGEIIELCNMEFDENGNEYYRDELELIGDYEPYYWEKLKHQATIDFMKSFLDKYDGTVNIESLLSNAIKLATALVNRLKEEEK
jgi:hypothetical protein